MFDPASAIRFPPAWPDGDTTRGLTPERACHRIAPGRRGSAADGVGVGVTSRIAAWKVAGRLVRAATAPPPTPTSAAPITPPPISTPRRETVRCPPSVIGGGGTLTGGAASVRAYQPGAAGATPEPSTMLAISSAVGRSFGRG